MNKKYLIGIISLALIVVLIIFFKFTLVQFKAIMGPPSPNGGGVHEESAPPPAPDLSKIVEEELSRLPLGKILFNPPEKMKVGVKERVEVRIAKTIKENFEKELKGKGIPQIEEIKVGTFMTARLKGDSFNIEPLSDESQLVSGDGFTQWEWNVTPLKSGLYKLYLSVAVRIKIAGIGEEKKDYPVFEKEINVKVNPIYSVKKFIKSYWQWIITTIIGSGIIGWGAGWFVKRRKKAGKKQ